MSKILYCCEYFAQYDTLELLRVTRYKLHEITGNYMKLHVIPNQELWVMNLWDLDTSILSYLWSV